MIFIVKAGFLDRANGLGSFRTFGRFQVLYIVNNKIKQIGNTHEDLLET